MGMYLSIHWNLDEIIGEVKQVYPGIAALLPILGDAIPDLVALSMRDRAAGADYYLDEFVRENLGSEYSYLGLFFKSQSKRWYQEVVRSASLYTFEYDEFFIEDICQLSPTVLLVKVWVEYHYEGCDLASGE